MAPRILVVEDEVTLAKNIAKYLRRYGYDTWIAESGETGLEMYATFKPDIVLLDFMLGGINGLEVMARIRARDMQTKIILMTAHGSVEIAVKAIKSGAYDYLSKPLVLSELRLLVDKAIAA